MAAAASLKNVPLITYSPECMNGESIFVSSNSLPMKAMNLEPAGHAFHTAALRLAGHYEKVLTGSEDKDVNDRVYVSADYYCSEGEKRNRGKAETLDYYSLLGLSHLRYCATEDQIRRNYREAALRHHPDKQASLLLAVENEFAKQAKRDMIESRFKAIQEAYEVLIDPVKRRIYDSRDEFDDEIPHGCVPCEFFKVFGPVFMRNGRWSVNQPVPSLGDDNTPLREVYSFYDFWYSFKSWREFPHTDEFDLEQAESREHKRWMERQNAKLSDKARKEEHLRIRTLVGNAYKSDPRMLKMKKERKAEKQRKKDAKLLGKRLQEEEEARIAEQEKLRKEEEEKRAAEAALLKKKASEKEKRLLRKERARLRTLSSPVLSQHLLKLTDDDVEKLCSSLDKDHLTNLCERMEGKKAPEKAKLLQEMLDNNHRAINGSPCENNPQMNSHVEVNGQGENGSTEEKDKSLDREEVGLLRKGVQNYPNGTSQRRK